MQRTFYNRNQFCIIKIWFDVQCCQWKWIKTIKHANCVWEGYFILSKNKIAEKTPKVLVSVIYSSNSISLLYTAVCDKSFLQFSSLKHHLLMLIRNGNRSHKCKRYFFKNWRLNFNLTGNREIWQRFSPYIIWKRLILSFFVNWDCFCMHIVSKNLRKKNCRYSMLRFCVMQFKNVVCPVVTNMLVKKKLWKGCNWNYVGLE